MSEKKEKKKLTKFQKWFRFLDRMLKSILRPVFPVKKYGHTEPFNDRAYLFVSNHMSNMDIVPTKLATDRTIHFLAKKELFQKGITKWFTKKCECIPVNRDGNDVRALMQAMKYLKNGENVAVFPEGTRNRTEEPFLPFKSGAAAIAVRTRTPVVPIVQVKKLRLFHKIHVLYGEPFEFTEYYDKKLTEEDIATCDEILVNKMLELHSELKEILKSKKKK